jgi:hypothetical protein
MEMVATAVIGLCFLKITSHPKAGWPAWAFGCRNRSLPGKVDQAGFRAGGLIALGCLSWGMDNHLTALIDGISPAQITFWKGIVAGSFNIILGLLIRNMVSQLAKSLVHSV